MKKILLLFAAMCCMMVANAQESEMTPPNDEIWYTSTDGNIIVPNNLDAFDAAIVSNTYENGKGVMKFDNPLTSIVEQAFAGGATLKSINLPSSVANIGNMAFARCSNLTSITISKGAIGDYAFYDCSTLSSVELKEGVKSIGFSAFANCYGNIGELIIPSSMTSIGEDAFGNCKYLTSATILGGSIGNFAFRNCTALSSVELKEGVKSIGNCAFLGCPGNIGELIIPSSVTSIGSQAFCQWGQLTSVTILNGSIGNEAFFMCRKLTTVSLQKGVTSIGGGAFIGCEGISGELTIPSSVTSIGGGAFNYCKNLEAVYLLQHNPENYSTDIFPDGLTLYVPFGVYEIYKNRYPKQNVQAMQMDDFAEYALMEIYSVWDENKDILTDADNIRIQEIIDNAMKHSEEDMSVALKAVYAIIDMRKDVEDVIGSLGTKQNGPALIVTDQDGMEIILYSPKSVEYIKVNDK